MECIWDTGAMVSLASEGWMNKNSPAIQARPLKEVLDEYPGLDLSAANHSSIQFSGWCELSMVTEGQELQVPFLITKIELEQPIIGCNVVEYLVREYPKVSLVKQLFPKLDRREEDWKQLISKIQPKTNENASVWLSQKDVTVEPGQVESVNDNWTKKMLL